jgi:Kef-type K+ transport system membrane component KefB
MEAFPQWVIVLTVVIVLTRVGGLLAKRLNIPSVTIQLLIGVLLGPSLLNLLGTPILLGTWGSPSPGPLHDVLKILAEVGLVQLMFLAGLEVDWQELKKQLKSSFSVGVWGFGLTAVIVAILTRLFVDRWSEALAVSAIMSASSFGISIYSFSEKKVLGSQAAAIVSGAAILSGLLAILLMIASQATNYGATHGAFKMAVAVSWFLAKLIMFFAIAYFLTSRYLTLVAKTGFRRNVPRPALEGIGGVEGHNMEKSYLTGKPPASLSRPNGMAGEVPKRPRQMLIGYLLLVASLYAWSAIHFGSFSAVGVASLGGALLGISNLEVREKIAKGFGSLLASIPMGILFIAIGMEVNLKATEDSITFLAVLLAAVIVPKLTGCWIATKNGYLYPGERVLIMIGVLAQGEMGILVAAYLFSRGVLSPQFFSIAILVAVGLTMVSPVLMRIASSGFGAQTTCVRTAGPERCGSFSQSP